ncbi:MAG: hypothetical protein H6Q72_978 [Firmicutes bacterium]|nr:hypothetical protein [Bacillota bacterium]
MATSSSSVLNTLLKAIAALGLTYAANKCVDSSTSWVDTRNQIVTTTLTTVVTALTSEATTTTDSTTTTAQ